MSQIIVKWKAALQHFKQLQSVCQAGSLDAAAVEALWDRLHTDSQIPFPVAKKLVMDAQVSIYWSCW